MKGELILQILSQNYERYLKKMGIKSTIIITGEKKKKDTWQLGNFSMNK